MKSIIDKISTFMTNIGIILLVFGIVFIPTESYIFIRYVFQPEGFWQEIILASIGLYFLIGIQILLVIIGIVFLIDLFFK